MMPNSPAAGEAMERVEPVITVAVETAVALHPTAALPTVSATRLVQTGVLSMTMQETSYPPVDRAVAASSSTLTPS